MSELTPIYSLPLFPLHHVLFPYIPLQLHVFEERYRVMINHCIDTNRPFGVVLIREGEEVGAPATPYEVGCVARILGVQRLEDGRMYLIAAGEERFRLLDYMEAEEPYLVGKVEALEDVPREEQPEFVLKIASAIKDVFVTYLARFAERTNREFPDVDLPEDPSQLSFCIAAIAQFPPDQKQKLLETTDVVKRLNWESAWLKEQIELWDQEDQQEGRSPAAEGHRFIIARSIDPEQDLWKKYLDESKN